MYVDMGKYAEAESMCAAAVHFYKTIHALHFIKLLVFIILDGTYIWNNIPISWFRGIFILTMELDVDTFSIPLSGSFLSLRLNTNDI